MIVDCNRNCRFFDNGDMYKRKYSAKRLDEDKKYV